MAKFYPVSNVKGLYHFFCPGCGCYHGVWTDREKSPCWQFNGDVERPTVSPSILVRYKHPKGYSNENPAPVGYCGEYVEEVCHSFIKEGRIQFLSDCTHKLTGQTVDLPEVD